MSEHNGNGINKDSLIQEEPLIWTSKGNLPVALLEHRCQWSFSDKEIVFVEEYWLGNECVKRAPNIFLKTPAIGNAESGKV